MTQTAFHQKIRITGSLTYDTAFHIGTGKEGEPAADMGVLKDAPDWPVLPGSTLKGCFRATAERLSGYLGATACLLDRSLSKMDCVGDQNYFMKVNHSFKNIRKEQKKLDWLGKNTCHICQLFGSPLQASRIFFSDGQLKRRQGGCQVRNGVVNDRDSGTACHGLKYDFGAGPIATSFEIFIEMENPTSMDLAIVGAVIAEWQSGFRLGGFSFRGQGRTVLTETRIEQVDYRNIAHLQAYLLKRHMQPADALLSDALQKTLNERGDMSC
jgi:CRISPR-associated RAMP protein (TIGR02581 family)